MIEFLRRHLALALVLCTLTLVTTSCGDDDDDFGVASSRLAGEWVLIHAKGWTEANGYMNRYDVSMAYDGLGNPVPAQSDSYDFQMLTIKPTRLGSDGTQYYNGITYEWSFDLGAWHRTDENALYIQGDRLYQPGIGEYLTIRKLTSTEMVLYYSSDIAEETQTFRKL